MLARARLCQPAARSEGGRRKPGRVLKLKSVLLWLNDPYYAEVEWRNDATAWAPGVGDYHGDRCGLRRTLRFEEWGRYVVLGHHAPSHGSGRPAGISPHPLGVPGLHAEVPSPVQASRQANKQTSKQQYLGPVGTGHDETDRDRTTGRQQRQQQPQSARQRPL